MMRAHHPDLGGDAAVYVEMLQRLEEEGAVDSGPSEVRFVKRRRRWRVPAPRPFRARRPPRVR